MSQAENVKAGKRFIVFLIALLLIVLNIYVISHLMVKEIVPCQNTDNVLNPCGTQECNESMRMLSWKNFAKIDSQGRVSLRNVGEIDWYIGGDRAKGILSRIRERTKEMDEARFNLDKELEKIADGLLDRKPVDDLAETILMGGYKKAYAQLNQLDQELYNADIGTIKSILIMLEQKMSAQCSDLEGLTPPLSRLFFWTTPTLSTFEVLFWALFGVLTNLLANSAEYLRKGTFQPIETWVAYTKLVYGPILAVVLVLALINGFFNIESYQVRVWTLPLVGFLFGYAARRTANAFDKLIEKFMGKAEKGIEAGPEVETVRRNKIVDELKKTLRPKDMDELKTQAKKLVKEMTAPMSEEKGDPR